MPVILWLVLVLSGLMGAYFYATVREEIRQLMPLEFQPRDIYAFHIRNHAFSSGVPLEIQRKYFLHEVFSVVAIACIAALFAVHAKYIPLLLFSAVAAYQCWILLKDLRRLFKATSQH
jgi:hypothetical protein